LRIPNTRASIKPKLSQEDTIVETELVLLKTCNKQITPSGKR
jgi:hypothetical protein